MDGEGGEGEEGTPLSSGATGREATTCAYERARGGTDTLGRSGRGSSLDPVGGAS